MNIKFLVVSYFIGLFVDWIFQSNWEATNKSKWAKNDNKFKSFNAVVSHSLVYSILTTFFTLVLINQLNPSLLVFIVLFTTHALIDTRIPVVWIMRLKGMSEWQIKDYTNYGFMYIGIDHRLHEMVLLILSLFI